MVELHDGLRIERDVDIKRVETVSIATTTELGENIDEVVLISGAVGLDLSDSIVWKGLRASAVGVDSDSSNAAADIRR